MGRIVALDVGDATIGIAATDELCIAAHPVRTIRRGESVKADLREVETALLELDASRVVVGLPVGQENEEGDQARKVKDFSDRLARRIRIPLVHWDERFSTAEARETMIDAGVSRARRRKRIDQAAAAVILESYLRSETSPGQDTTPGV